MAGEVTNEGPLPARVDFFLHPGVSNTRVAYDYSSGAACSNDGKISYSDVNSGEAARFSGWVFYADAITPNDPTGDAAVGRQVLDPILNVAGRPVETMTAYGPRVIWCEGFRQTAGIVPGGPVPTVNPALFDVDANDLCYVASETNPLVCTGALIMCRLQAPPPRDG